MSKQFITRFAPSPTGLLHLGHAYSALLAFRAAQKKTGRFILRIEDIDTTRARPEFEEAIYRDLEWLEITWEQPVRRQTDHLGDYKKALKKLENLGVLYPCFCSRADIRKEIKSSTNAPHGPEGPLYPGTCRQLSGEEQTHRENQGMPFAIRLNLIKALEKATDPLVYFEKGEKTHARPEVLGDVVLARKESPSSYHLSVVVDDHLQSITHIIRGQDLEHSTPVHCLLQNLLGYSRPHYHHHALLTDKEGKRFAKRERSLSLEELRTSGHRFGEIKNLIEEFGGTLSEVPF